MRVELKIDPRNDPGCDRHPLTADWVPVGGNGGFELRDSAELEWGHVLVKVRRVDRDQGKIAIMRDEQDSCRVLVWVSVALNRDVASIAYHVSVGHDSIAIDDKTRADSALKRAGIPRSAIIRLNFCHRDPDETFLNRAVGLWRRHRDRHHGRWRWSRFGRSDARRKVLFGRGGRRILLLRKTWQRKKQSNTGGNENPDRKSV